MTQSYDQAIQDAYDFFVPRLRVLPPLRLSEDGFAMGTDSLDGEYAQIVSECHAFMFAEKRYDLSYNQLCQAFFRAVTAAGNMDFED